MTTANIVSELSCPIDWQLTAVGNELGRWLDFLWFARCLPHEADWEVSRLFATDDWRVSTDRVGDLDASEIQCTLHNIRVWAPSLREPYREFGRRFTSLAVADRETYKKHYPPSNSSMDELCALSLQRNASVLVPEATPKVQMDLVWAALDDLAFGHMAGFGENTLESDPIAGAKHLESLLANASLLVAVQFCRRLGASHGVPTSYGMIDFDFSTPQFHMYPITESEYQEATHQAYVQGWNFGLPK